jgi:hypothetical protein
MVGGKFNKIFTNFKILSNDKNGIIWCFMIYNCTEITDIHTAHIQVFC